ncbi:MAG: hypothetical protein MI919_24090, partial [Holophagales bacterium]|nr:hypothetical protein [Holophagales bacterium]
QDPLAYFPRTHHTHIDTYEHLSEEDLIQASIVVASFAYHAAERDELFPRKPIPQKPPEDARKKRAEEKAAAEKAAAEAAKAEEAKEGEDAPASAGEGGA